MSSFCLLLGNVYGFQSISSPLLRVCYVLNIILDIAMGDAREIYNIVSNFEYIIV
jgi:hypothetical protein